MSVELFIATIDSQLQELKCRFNESVTKLLCLSVMIYPINSLNVEDICKLITSYYPFCFLVNIGRKILLIHFLWMRISYKSMHENSLKTL
uniref:Uncharacterized protein n=1 Tax=Lactuca sativa TaxID=4236 RepID=A0A9R1XB52_LACSA|nr:hypothetical protein LSAT_V11C600325550 [Lactuca sativa]